MDQLRELQAENAALRLRVAALQESEQRFRKYFHQGLIGMAVVKLDHGWVECNDRLCEILGYPRAELLKKTWLELTHPEDVPLAVAHFQQLASGAIEHYTIDKRYIRKDGTAVYTTITVQAFRNSDGQIDCVVGLMEDISARKRAEEAAERERQTLWQMLQASDHELQTISYDIHDGLAQYLAAAGMQLQVFESLRASQPDEAQQAYAAARQLVGQAHGEARRLISAVRPPIIDEIGLETALAHLVHEQRRRGSAQIEYDSNVQFDRLPPILENSLYRIAQEALANACKHSGSKLIRMVLAQNGPQLRFEVQDWGCGFDPQRVAVGHFGLEGIRQRVRLLGGPLTIDSVLGAGTRLQVVVPLVEYSGTS